MLYILFTICHTLCSDLIKIIYFVIKNIFSQIKHTRINIFINTYLVTYFGSSESSYGQSFIYRHGLLIQCAHIVYKYLNSTFLCILRIRLKLFQKNLNILANIY